jgi:hypothetical protein
VPELEVGEEDLELPAEEASQEEGGLVEGLITWLTNPGIGWWMER